MGMVREVDGRLSVGMICEVKGTQRVAALFGDWQETMIWSCIQGVMGRLYADSAENPKSAMAMLGDFCFFAGTPNEELVGYRPEGRGRDFAIMTASSPEWYALIERMYGGKATRVSRYAFKKEPEVFDRARLKALAENVGEGYVLQMMDRELFACCQSQEWSRDFVSLFEDYDQYRRLGLGVVALRDGKPVSGASSYSSYQGGIEVEIDTKKEYRRQGLATACGARLILECLNRGLYPSWDAQNAWSSALAEKLGYRFDHEYTAYEINDSR